MGMQVMREKSDSLLLMLVFGVIIASFILFFGPASQGLTSSSNVVGKVNGSPITIGEWSFNYNQLYDRNMRYNPNFNAEQAEAMNLKGQAFDQIVERILTAQAAMDMGLRASREEVAKEILDTPSFQAEDQFDKDLYRRVVNFHFHMSIQRFEDQQLKDMAGMRIRRFLMDAPVVAPEAMFDEWAVRNDKISLQFVRFKKDDFISGEEPTEDEIAAFVKDGEEEIQKYYDTHTSEFRNEEEVKARHILLKVEEGADETVIEAKAKEIYEKAKAEGADFAKLAEEYSEGPTKTKGGDLGWFGRKRMVKEFEDKAFAMKAGEVSEPVKTMFGWHIIKVEERKEAQDRAFDTVKEEIAKKVLIQKRDTELAKEKAESFLARLKAGESLEVVFPEPEEEAENTEEESSWKVEETGLFARGSTNYIPRIGPSDELKDAVWKLSMDKPLADRLFEVDGDIYIVRLKEHKEPDPTQFDSEKDQMLASARMRMGGMAYRNWLEEMKEDASIVAPSDFSKITFKDEY